MSETAKQLFGGLKNFVPEVKAEFARLGTQGAMELASALFGNGAFVPYGPGQYTPGVAQEQQAGMTPEQSAEPVLDMQQGIQQEMERSRGMER